MLKPDILQFEESHRRAVGSINSHRRAVGSINSHRRAVGSINSHIINAPDVTTIWIRFKKKIDR